MNETKCEIGTVRGYRSSRFRFREWRSRLRQRLLEDQPDQGLGGPPNNWRSIKILAETYHDKDGQKYGFREVYARFNNDAFEIWIGENWNVCGHEDSKWKWHDRTEVFRRIALWYLWRWAWGEWFGLRRKLFYWDLHRRVERMKSATPAL